MGFFRISSPRTSNKFACYLPNRFRVSYEKSRKIGLSQGKWFWTSLRWLRWKIRRKKRGIDVPNPWSTSKTIHWRKQKLKCGDNNTLMKRGGIFCIQINVKSLPLLFFFICRLISWVSIWENGFLLSANMITASSNWLQHNLVRWRVK